MTHPLPPQGPHEPDDLLPGEAALRALYGKPPQNEPGPALDAAVLRAAAEAVSSESTNRSATRNADGKHGSRTRWFIGLSSAATVVLAAGLAWRMRSLPQPDNSPPAVSEQVGTHAASKPTAQASRVSAPAARQPPPARVLDAARSPQSMKAVAERSETQAAREQATAESPTPPAPPAPPAPATPAPAALSADEVAAQDARPALAAELTAIRQLFAEHHEQEAQQRLEAFRRLHPQWPLPADLQARVRKP